MQEFINKQMVTVDSNSSQLGIGNSQLYVGNPDMNSASWDAATTIITGTTLAGNIVGGMYAYNAKGGFWWTLLGIIVGGAAGNVTGRLVTLPLRH